MHVRSEKNITLFYGVRSVTVSRCGNIASKKKLKNSKSNSIEIHICWDCCGARYQIWWILPFAHSYSRWLGAYASDTSNCLTCTHKSSPTEVSYCYCFTSRMSATGWTTTDDSERTQKWEMEKIELNFFFMEREISREPATQPPDVDGDDDAANDDCLRAWNVCWVTFGSRSLWWRIETKTNKRK